MDHTWISGNSIVVVAAADRVATYGLDWEQAVRLLPSIDTPDLHGWLRAHGDTNVLVVPGDGCPAALRALPHREICIPALEFALFATVLSARPPRPCAPVIAAGPAA
ncbi:hypothetical protein [Nocardia huaxiensis]|uniref:Uncharacterized protein n=1 Tax=Nocardia huaxiensis TaxID=2755382 RepID=A0A7D6VEE0_9NOCA|nr:hypothetical protein [Nocardia huaxiensis]QLY33371.1 hypothetical protein H0264_15055 [Nocardia huaxiensis]UFS99717.1 hypothetical protein LPY97_18475 [Nocardia huaxiensis]